MAGDDGSAGKENLQAGIATLEYEHEHAKSDLLAQRGKEAWFKGLVEIAPEAMMVHGADQKIVYINPAGMRLFGTTSMDQIIGTLATNLIHPDSRQSVSNRIDGFVSGVVPSSSTPEQRRGRLDRTDFHADVTATGDQGAKRFAEVVPTGKKIMINFRDMTGLSGN